MVRDVTTRPDRLEVFQEVAQPTFEILRQGTIGNLSQIEQVNAMFEEGEFGELQLFLRDGLTDDDRPDIEESIAELELMLIETGALPWPGRRRIAELDWPKRTVRFFFLQGAPFLLVFAVVMIAAAAIAAFTDEIADVLRSVGIDVPASVENTVQAAALFVLIAGAVFLLARTGIPLFILIPGGLLVFALLAPDTAFRILKWSREAVQDTLGIDILPVAAGVALAAGGLFVASRGGGPAIAGGVVAAGVGGVIAFQGFRGAEGASSLPQGPPRPGEALLVVVGEPSFDVVTV